MTSLQCWVLLSAVMFLKMFANSVVQGLVRLRTRVYVRAEDAKFFGRNAEVQAQPHPIDDRGQAAWRNDLENIPIFLIIGLGFVLSDGPAHWAMLYFGAFAVARIAHTLFQLFPKQPHRNIAYQGGIAATFALAIHSVILAF